MFQDARQLLDKTQLVADICIIGAGAAGITLATDLIGTGHQVLLLESGGLKYDSTTQALYEGINVGLLYEPLDLCRERTFGGSTALWGGWCKPLASLDFEHRDWVPLSGWPITQKDIAPYYRRAFATFSLPLDTENLAEAEVWSDDALPIKSPFCRIEPCALSPAPRLGKVNQDRLKGARNIRVLLHANVTEIVTDASARRATSLNVATLDGKTHHVTARYFILAAGGIENARLLLLSDRVQQKGLGNGSDFVGRCFMEHPRFSWGRLLPNQVPVLLRRYDPRLVVAQRDAGQMRHSTQPLFGLSLALTEKAQREHRLLGARTWIVPTSRFGERPGSLEFKELIFWLKKRRIPSDLKRRYIQILRDLPNVTAVVASHVLSNLRPARQWQFITLLEQEPCRESRMTLDTCCDMLGLRRVCLDWRLGELTKRTFDHAREIFTADLRASGLFSRLEDLDGQRIDAPRWVRHHMGTTRMAVSPNEGVVNANCRVHTIANVYIAGSSVFPTVGNDMPTLTIVALAHRLADHIKVQLTKDLGGGATIGAESDRAPDRR